MPTMGRAEPLTITSRTRVSRRRPRGPPGVRPGEVLDGEAARVEQRERERVAQRQGGGRAGRGREPQRAGLGVDRRIEMHVGGLRERRLLVAGQRDDRQHPVA